MQTKLSPDYGRVIQAFGRTATSAARHLAPSRCELDLRRVLDAVRAKEIGGIDYTITCNVSKLDQIAARAGQSNRHCEP